MTTLLTILMYLPFLVLTIFANLGNTRNWARYLTYALLILTNLLLVLLGSWFLFTAALAPKTPELAEFDFIGMGIICIAIGLLAFIPLLHPVRRGLARAMPIDPHACVHTMALVFAVYLIGMSALNLLLVPSIARSDPQSLTISPWTAWAQMAVFVLLALVGVGLFLRRGIRTTLERLNLRGISLPQFGVAVGAVVGTQLVVWGIDFVWKMLSPASFASVSQIGQALFGNFVGVAGALTLGISAGIGEEMLFRGAIQPRFGFWATAVLFMVAHTQYTISPALLEILVLAVVLGVLRDRTSTTVCILVHAAYNALTMLMPVPF